MSSSAQRSLVALLALGLALPGATWLAGAGARTRLAQRFPAPGVLVDIGGYQMHLNCAGQGSPTVVLEAGLDDFSIFWSLVQPEAAKFTRVCAYDRAGSGWSQVSPYPRTSEVMVKELHALLARAGVEPPYVLVGHSFGGALVRQYAHIYHDEVVGMVLVDAAHSELFARIPAWSRATAQMLGFYRVLAPLSAFGLLALTPQYIPARGLPDEAAAQYRAVAVTTSYFATGIAERENFESNLIPVRTADAAGFGDMPLVVVSRGQWDPLPGISDAENAQAWAAWQAMQSELTGLSSNSEQVVAGRSGHSVQLQQPELVVAAIRQVAGLAHP